MRTLIYGGRNFNDEDLFRDTMSNLPFKVTEVVSGMAKGADTMAVEWANEKLVNVLEFPADWKKYPGRAGPIRNQQMIDEGQPEIAIEFPGGKGTADMRARLDKAGIPVIEAGKPAIATQPRYVVYGRTNCPYCTSAIKLLQERKLTYDYRDVNNVSVLGELRALQPGVKTIPQVYEDNVLIGGFTELKEHFKDK